MSRNTKFALFALCFLVLAAVVFNFLRASLTRPLLFPAPPVRLNPQLPQGQLLEFSGTRKTYGYYAPGGPRLIVFFHGNGEVMGSMQDLARQMQQAGSSVLLAEYPGYGYAAAYEATEQNIYTDNEFLIRQVQKQFHHRAEDTVLWGFSLGTGVAVEMAKRRLGELVILFAPFASMATVAAHHFTTFADWLVVDRFDSLAKAKSLQQPAIIVHGDRDEVIPLAQALTLAKAIRHSRFYAISGAGHNDLLALMPGSVWDAVQRAAQTGQLPPLK